jgi:hypothetical protein
MQTHIGICLSTKILNKLFKISKRPWNAKEVPPGEDPSPPIKSSISRLPRGYFKWPCGRAWRMVRKGLDLSREQHQAPKILLLWIGERYLYICHEDVALQRSFDPRRTKFALKIKSSVPPEV